MSTQPSIDTVRQTTHLGPDVVKLLRSYEARIAALETKVEELTGQLDAAEDRLPPPEPCPNCGGGHDASEC